MFKRKLIGFLATVFLTSVILTFLDPAFGIVETFGLSLLFSSILISCLGVPSSLLSDFFTRLCYGKLRMIMALFIHLGFGLLFGYIIFTGLLMLVTVVAAFIFWLTDEVIRIKWKHKIESKVPIHYEM